MSCPLNWDGLPTFAEQRRVERLVTLHRALGHPARLAIIRELARHPAWTRGPLQLVGLLPFSLPPADHHLEVLELAGLLHLRRGRLRVDIPSLVLMRDACIDTPPAIDDARAIATDSRSRRRRVAREVETMTRAIAEAPAQLILYWLRHHGARTPEELAVDVGLPSGELAAQIERLVKAGVAVCAQRGTPTQCFVSPDVGLALGSFFTLLIADLEAGGHGRASTG